MMHPYSSTDATTPYKKSRFILSDFMMMDNLSIVFQAYTRPTHHFQYTYIYIYIHTYIYMWGYVCIYIYIYILHIYMYIYIYIVITDKYLKWVIHRHKI